MLYDSVIEGRLELPALPNYTQCQRLNLGNRDLQGKINQRYAGIGAMRNTQFCRQMSSNPP
jgi:hypothetical protein